MAANGAATSTSTVEITWAPVNYPADGAAEPTGYELWGDGGTASTRRRLQAGDEYSSLSLIATYGPDILNARITVDITPLSVYKFAIK